MRKALLLGLIVAPLMAFAADKTGGNYEVTFPKGEMHCEDCAKTVQEALAKLPEVQPGTVQVSLQKNTAVLTVKEGQKISLDEVKKALSGAGYTVTAVNLKK